MANALVISSAVLVGAAIVSFPLSRIADHLGDFVKTLYNPDGTRRNR